jgi:hypothetical protein
MRLALVRLLHVDVNGRLEMYSSRSWHAIAAEFIGPLSARKRRCGINQGILRLERNHAIGPI